MDTTYTGTGSNTILLGYGAQSLTLAAVDKSAVELKSFIWSPATGLSSTTRSFGFQAKKSPK